MYFVFLLYLASIGLAFAAGHSFVVLDSGEMLLFGVSFLGAPLLIAVGLLNTHKHGLRFVVVAFHILLAVLFHPEVTVKDPLYLDKAEQFELLRTIHENTGTWSLKSDVAYDLARAVKSDATLQLKYSNPLLYWAFPPSIVLALWGVAFFFYFPQRADLE